MPASQKTPNYQLPIYAEEDVTSYLQDFNPAMQKIDTQMKANADAAAAAQSDADSLDTRVTALEDAPAGVTELDSDTDVTGFENGYILINNNGKLGAIEPSGGTGTDPNAIHASGGGTFSASEGIGSTGPYNIVVDEEPAGVPITSDDVTVPESASAFAGQTVTEALESLQGGGSSGAAAENVSYDNAASGLTATNVQDAIDEECDYLKKSIRMGTSYDLVTLSLIIGGSFTYCFPLFRNSISTSEADAVTPIFRVPPSNILFDTSLSYTSLKISKPYKHTFTIALIKVDGNTLVEKQTVEPGTTSIPRTAKSLEPGDYYYVLKSGSH